MGALDKVLKALAELHSAGEERPTKAMVGVYAGVDPATSTMRSVCATLKKKNLADTSEPKTLKLTQAGHDHARTLADVQLPSSNEEFHDRIKKKLKGAKPRQVYDLLRSGPPLTKAEIGQAIDVDIKKSTFRSILADLNKFKLLEKLSDDRYRLTDKCYPLGRDIA